MKRLSLLFAALTLCGVVHHCQAQVHPGVLNFGKRLIYLFFLFCTLLCELMLDFVLEVQL